MLSSLQANSARDTKKKTKPYSYLDFSFYKPSDDGENPEGHYGAAFMELVKSGKAPSWTLFCYKELASGATPNYVPGEPALIAEDAILLHPVLKGNEWHGMLIARESAGDKYRQFTSTRGETYRLKVPDVETKIVAREGEILTP